jgi:hypothetical protein
MQLARRKQLRDGSTANVMLLHGRDPDPAADGGGIALFCANVGDSRAVLCRGGASSATHAWQTESGAAHSVCRASWGAPLRSSVPHEVLVQGKIRGVIMIRTG